MNAVCQKCGKRPATEWLGSQVHRRESHVCYRCALVANIEEAQAQADRLPKLAAELTALIAKEGE